MPTSGKAVMENVRKYRAIASLYRRTATFRPQQSWSLLRQADEWEQLGKGVLILSEKAGLIHYKEPESAMRLLSRPAGN